MTGLRRLLGWSTGGLAVVYSPLLLLHREGYYYLFFSSHAFDQVEYNIRVARSKVLEQRFLRGEAPVLETDWERWPLLLCTSASCRWAEGRNTTFVGPGHPSVVEDQWLVYHSWLWGRLQPANEEPGRQLLLDELEWGQDGWPRGRGGRPSDTPQEQPGVGPVCPK